VLIRGLGAVDLWKKTRGRKSRDTVSLTFNFLTLKIVNKKRNA
jgi:hypothetical protein